MKNNWLNIKLYLLLLFSLVFYFFQRKIISLRKRTRTADGRWKDRRWKRKDGRVEDRREKIEDSRVEDRG